MLYDKRKTVSVIIILHAVIWTPSLLDLATRKEFSVNINKELSEYKQREKKKVKSHALISWDASLSVIFRIGPVRITGFFSHFVYKGATKGNFEKAQKFNEFIKLSSQKCSLPNSFKLYSKAYIQSKLTQK